MTADRDPGDAVPAGVAPQTPVPLTREDEQVLENLERIGHDKPSMDSPSDGPGLRADREVEAISQGGGQADRAPSRSGITGPGSGADAQ